MKVALNTIGGLPNIFAIDPGKHQCACALFEGGELVRVEFGNGPYWDNASAPELDAVVVERMQADERTRNIDVRDLLACQFRGALAAGLASGGWCKVIDLTPTQWKGSEPKPVQHARLFGVNAHLTGDAAVLTAAEMAVLGGAATARTIAAAVDKGARDRWGHPGADYYPKPTTRAAHAYADLDPHVIHNLLDAVALGCFHLGRLAKR